MGKFLAVGLDRVDLDLEFCLSCLAALEIASEDIQLTLALELLDFARTLRRLRALFLSDGTRCTRGREDERREEGPPPSRGDTAVAAGGSERPVRSGDRGAPKEW